MKPADLVRSKWMTAEDFGRDNVPKEPTVTIKSIVHQKMSKTETWGVFHFKEEWAKPLKAITTHRSACERMFGDRDTDDWVGKRLTLYAKAGNYPNGKRFAVRIKGSPDIKQTLSFQVRGFAGSTETYNLVPTGANIQLGPGVVRFGQKSGAWGKPFDEFDEEQLEQLVKDARGFLADPKNASGKWAADLEANVKEIVEHLAQRMAARMPPPDPEPLPEPPL